MNDSTYNTFRLGDFSGSVYFAPTDFRLLSSLDSESFEGLFSTTEFYSEYSNTEGSSEGSSSEGSFEGSFSEGSSEGSSEVQSEVSSESYSIQQTEDETTLAHIDGTLSLMAGFMIWAIIGTLIFLLARYFFSLMNK